MLKHNNFPLKVLNVFARKKNIDTYLLKFVSFIEIIKKTMCICIKTCLTRQFKMNSVILYE